MSKEDAIFFIAKFAAKVKRWKVSDEGFSCLEPNPNTSELVVKILVDPFIWIDDFFEGMRVLGGMKLPARDVKNLEDIELAEIVRKRRGGKKVKVQLEDL